VSEAERRKTPENQVPGYIVCIEPDFSHIQCSLPLYRFSDHVQKKPGDCFKKNYTV